MLRKTGLFFLGALLVGVPSAWAQRVEVSFKGGYTASEGVTSADRALVGAQYNAIEPVSGGAFHLTFGVYLTENVQAEFLWGQQSSKLQADGPFGSTEVSKMTINNYMVNFVQNWGASDSKIRPYAFGGLGATNYSIGDLLIDRPAGTQNAVDGSTKFSTNWGGGVKFYFSKNVGASVGLRWTPTYIKSDPAGVWCDPWYGCWQLVDNQYSHQFETAFGLNFRF